MLFECDNTHGGNLMNQDGVLSNQSSKRYHPALDRPRHSFARASR
jgi:hypothetical protein